MPFVQSRREAGGTFFSVSTSNGVTLPAPSTQGNTLLAILTIREGENLNSVVDDAGNVYTLARQHFHSGDAVRAWVYVCFRAAPANTITFTVSATFDNAASMNFIELSAVNTLGQVNSADTVGAGPTVPDSGNVNTIKPNAMTIGVVASDGTGGWTIDADYTAITTDVGVDTNSRVGYREHPSPTTDNFTPSAAEASAALAIIVALEMVLDGDKRPVTRRPAPYAPGRIR